MGFLRPIGHLLKAIFIITLPATFLPFLSGLIEGVLIADFLISSTKESALYLAQDLDAVYYEALLKTSTGLSVSDTPLPPFHVPRVWNPANWWTKLGLDRFDLGGPENEYFTEGHDSRVLAFVDGLVRKNDESEQGKPWHHWIYASSQTFHLDEVLVDEWDRGFQEFVQYQHANPTIANANLSYISCPYSYLCSSWRTRGPALIHFTTEPLSMEPEEWTEEDEDIDPTPKYETVTVRIIELPIRTENLGLPGEFPSPFNQMRFLIGESSPWQLFEPYSEVHQFLARVVDLLKASENTHPKLYGALVKLERRVRQFLGFEDAVTVTIARFSGIFATIFLTMGVRFILDRVIRLFTMGLEYLL